MSIKSESVVGKSESVVGMIRLTLLLCAGMFLALTLGGEDRGQLRPGLAKAASEGRLNLNPAPEPVAEPAIVAAPAPVPAPAANQQITPVAYAPEPAPTPAPVAARTRTVPEPVFTLSGLTDTPLPLVDAEPAAAQANQASLDGQVYYITANTVNVRQGPSTDASVVSKLERGEAALAMWQEGDEWTRIIIQGDGVEGYVATRFLSPTAP